MRKNSRRNPTVHEQVPEDIWMGWRLKLQSGSQKYWRIIRNLNSWTLWWHQTFYFILRSRWRSHPSGLPDHIQATSADKRQKRHGVLPQKIKNRGDSWRQTCQEHNAGPLRRNSPQTKNFQNDSLIYFWVFISISISYHHHIYDYNLTRTRGA